MNGKIFALFLVVVFCVIICNVSADIRPQCLLPLNRGPCRAVLSRFGYNPQTNQCEHFLYGGCGGNENNFASMGQCMKSCSVNNENHASE